MRPLYDRWRRLLEQDGQGPGLLLYNVGLLLQRRHLRRQRRDGRRLLEDVSGGVSSTATISKGCAGDGARAGASRASSGRRSGGVGDSAGGALSTGGVSSARASAWWRRAAAAAPYHVTKEGVARRAGADCGTARGSRAAARSTSTKGSCELVLALLAGDGRGLWGRRRRDAALAVPCLSLAAALDADVRPVVDARAAEVAACRAGRGVVEGHGGVHRGELMVRCAAPCLLVWRRALLSGAAATARSREAFAGLSAVSVTGAQRLKSRRVRGCGTAISVCRRSAGEL